MVALVVIIMTMMTMSKKHIEIHIFSIKCSVVSVITFFITNLFCYFFCYKLYYFFPCVGNTLVQSAIFYTFLVYQIFIAYFI